MLKRTLAASLAILLGVLAPVHAAAPHAARLRLPSGAPRASVAPRLSIAPSSLPTLAPAPIVAPSVGAPAVTPAAAPVLPAVQQLAAELAAQPAAAPAALDAHYDLSAPKTAPESVSAAPSAPAPSLPRAAASPARAKTAVAKPAPAAKVSRVNKAARIVAWTALGVVGAVAVAKVGMLSVAAISGTLLVSVLLHESAHILGLRIWGDPTPKDAGRDTINPLKHIDPLGTILLPAASVALSAATLGFPLLFGWAKPVPVDFNKLENPKTDAAKVAMLGPATNLALAAVAGLALLALPAGGAAAFVAATVLKMNLALTVFNLLPLPQLDGGKLLVSLLPKSAYARWIHNPNLRSEYQGFYQRIYEGPANLLSKLHVHSLEHVNGLTRVVSLAALGAFYAVFFSALQVPLLFLALPCSYDYWCIREKVRSEAAVKDLMDIMSQWSTVIVQVAEDLGVESEVSAYETEHAMKNALETLIDELMEKDDFKALSDDEKIEAVLKAYPDKAAQFMKDKAMTEDSLETIKKVLADARNTPYYERLRKWMKDHEIFKRWGNAHTKEKLKDELKQAGNDKTRSNGGPTHMHSIAGLVLSLFGGGMVGAIDDLAARHRSKINVGEGVNAASVRVVFAFGETDGHRAILEQHGVITKVFEGNNTFLVTLPNAETAGRLAWTLAQLDEVENLVINAFAAAHVAPSFDWRSKVTTHAEFGEGTMLVRFAGGVTDAERDGLLGSIRKQATGDGRWRVDADDAGQAAEVARALADSRLVLEVLVHDAAGSILRLPAPKPAVLRGDNSVARRQLKITRRDGSVTTLIVNGGEAVRAEVERLLGERSVATVKAHPEDLVAEGKGWLVQFPEGTTREQMESAARAWNAKLLDDEFRGGKGLGFFEADARPDVESARPLKQQAPLAELPAEAPKPAKRKAEAAWQQFLNTRTLIDGKATLTPKQVQLISMFVKPVQAKTDAPTPPVVGRSAEIKRIMPILTSPRGMRNSVILVGEAGVGKTAVAEGLAQLVEEAEAPGAGQFLEMKRLKGRWVVELDLDALLTSESPVDALNALLQLLPLLNDPEPGTGNQIILVMDEIQKLFMDPAGVKMANAMKGILRQGRLAVLATTTEREFKKYIEGDDAFRRRLELVRVEEPTVPQTIEMLRGAKTFLEKLHNALIPDETLVTAAKLHAQFDKANYNPDKSFKGVQDSAELSRPENLRAAISLEVRETWRALQVAVYEARQALLDKGIASAVALPTELYNQLAELSRKAASLYAELEAVKDGKGQVTPDVIKRNLSIKTGISAGQLTLGDEDTSRYVRMEEEISRRVVSQERAIRALASAIRRNKAGISDPNRPMAKFLFVGPTGTGKTYLAKQLAKFLFHDEDAVARIDMSEYQQEHEVSKLIGSPPGYVGYGEGGQLTEKIRKKPYSVVLFDEIEKAHPKVWDILLQILDDGRLTDGEGRTIDFKNTVILMTSNTGMAAVDGEKYERLLKMAKTPEEVARIEAEWDAEIAEAIKQGIRDRFRPEFINRLDEDPNSKDKWVTFERLRPQDMGRIARLQVSEFTKLLKERHDTELVIADEVYDLLAREGFHPLYGARPMKGTIDKLIVDPLAQWILSEAEKGSRQVRGGLIRVGLKDGALVFEALPKPEKVLEKATVTGAAEALVQGVLKLVETQDEFGPADLEGLLRGPSAAEAATEAAPRAGFVAGAAPKFDGQTVSAAHNNPNKKDDNVRYAVRNIPAAAREALWPEAAVGVLEPGEGQVGVGFLKHFVRHAKERAAKAGVSEPVTLKSEITADAIRVVIGSKHLMSDEEAAVLSAHFSGAPPASYLEAQQRADNLNLGSAMVWDHNLLDLYRRLSALPNARWGVGRSASGTTYWLEIRREAPAAEQASLTPHQMRENAKVRSLLWRVVSAKKDDGHAMLVAASRGFVALSEPEQLAEARQRLEEGGWARHGGTESQIQENWAVIMTAAGVMGRFGGADDIPALETLARRLTSTAHNYVPLHNALAEALAELYTRAGLAEARRALESAKHKDQYGNDRETDSIKRAALRALGRLGGTDVVELVAGDAEAYAAYLRRHDPRVDAALLGTDAWKSLKDDAKIALLRLVGERGGEEFLPKLNQMLNGKIDGSRVVRYAAARAWAELCARLGLTRDLPEALRRYLNAQPSLESYDNADWQHFLALVYLAELAGGADSLPLIADVLAKPAHGIASVHEQAYFSTPMTWAAMVVRNGLFGEQAEKIQQMLVSHKPMEASAALHALIEARLHQQRRNAPPQGDVPKVEPGQNDGDLY